MNNMRHLATLIRIAYSTSAKLPPGKHVPIRIELADAQSAPESRQIDLSQMKSLNLFVFRPESDFEILVDNVRLTDRIGNP